VQVLPVESVLVKKIVVGTKGQLLQEAVVAKAQQELQQLLGAAVKLSVVVVLPGP
jgi:GTPase Era involved in 16S rRNA processing